MKGKIANRVIKQGLFDWKNAKWFQPKDLKKQTPEERAKLKEGIIQNGLLSPFMVWQNGKKTYILDGHHRDSILREIEQEGVIVIPKMLPGVWVDCNSKKEAVKFILIYNSHYAQFQRDPLLDFASILDTDSLLSQIDIPGIDLKGLFGPVDDQQEKDFGKLSRLYGAPPFSVLDTKQYYWQERKRLWISLGIQSEEGRGENLLRFSKTVQLPRGKNAKR